MNIGNLKINKLCLGDVEVTKAYLGDVEVYSSKPKPEGKYMTMTVLDDYEGTVISPIVHGSLPNLNLQYRINNGEWNDFIVGTTADIHLTAGDFVQFKGVNESGLSVDYSNYLNFDVSGNPVSLSGNVMSLIDGVGDTLVIPSDYCFYYLFHMSNVKTVSSDFLPATTITNGCYNCMFSDCQNLTQAPALPATSLAQFCYHSMFEGCQNLTQAPVLPATSFEPDCYTNMFFRCSNLSYVKSMATEGTINSGGTAPMALYNWLEGVASSGTFVKPASAVYVTDSPSGIPSGWTIQNI